MVGWAPNGAPAIDPNGGRAGRGFGDVGGNPRLSGEPGSRGSRSGGRRRACRQRHGTWRSGVDLQLRPVATARSPTRRSARPPKQAGGASSAAGSASAWFRSRAVGSPFTQAPGPSGYWYFPMSVTALPIESIGDAMGRDVSSVVGSNMVVMGQTSATLVGAQAGDILDLVAADGSIAQFLVGRVAPDAEVGGTEIVMSTSQADLLGRDAVDQCVDLRPIRPCSTRRRAGGSRAQHRRQDPRAQVVGSVRSRQHDRPRQDQDAARRVRLPRHRGRRRARRRRLACRVHPES